jgi:hypothetical protein
MIEVKMMHKKGAPDDTIKDIAVAYHNSTLVLIKNKFCQGGRNIAQYLSIMVSYGYYTGSHRHYYDQTDIGGKRRGFRPLR